MILVGLAGLAEFLGLIRGLIGLLVIRGHACKKEDATLWYFIVCIERLCICIYVDSIHT